MSMNRFFLFFAISFLLNFPADGAKGLRQKTVQYGFVLENTTSHPVEMAELWAYGPALKTSSQKCVKVESSLPHEKIFDKLGNQILHFKVGTIPPFGRQQVTVKASLLMTDKPKKERLSRRAKKKWLLPGPLVESTDSTVVELSSQLKERNKSAFAKNIFQWISENLKYTGHLSAARGARQSLSDRKGDCTEAMHLFMALSRAAQIPARGAGGYILMESGTPSPASYHNWAEYHDGARWRLSDPQKGVFAEKESDYVVFKIINGLEDPKTDFHRFRFQGEGLQVRMTE